MPDDKILIKVELEGEGSAKKELKDVKKATSDAKKEAKEYNKTLVDGAKDVKLFGVSINGLKTAMGASIGVIKNSVVALKSFKIALAATGIGLIVVALGSLVTFLTKSQRGLDFLTKGFDVFGAIVDVVFERIIKFGEGVFKFITGDFKEGIDLMGDAFTDVGERITEVTKASLALSDATVRLRENQNSFIVTNAKLRAELKEYNRQAENINLTLQERVKYSEMAEEVENRRAQEAIRLAEEELRILIARQAQGENLDADNKERAELEARIYQMREESEERLTTQGNKTRLLRQQIFKNEIKDRIAFETQKVQEFQKLGELEVNNDLNIKMRMVDNSEQKAELEKAIEREKNAAIFAESAGLFGALAGLIGQNSVFGKAAAIAEATINSFVAGTSALRDTPGGPIIKGIALATVIATGLATVKRILSVQLPQVQPVESSFADGGFIKGPSHARGGVNINAEGGEYIISKDRMRNPYVRSMAMKLNNFKQSKQSRFALGGFVNQDPNMILLQAVRNLEKARPVLVTNDLDAALTQRSIQVTTSTI
jgi:hypothetical protein